MLQIWKKFRKDPLYAYVTKRWCWIKQKSNGGKTEGVYPKNAQRHSSIYKNKLVFYSIHIHQYSILSRQHTEENLYFFSINTFKISKQSLCINLRYIAW